VRFVFAKTQRVLLTVLAPLFCALAAQASDLTAPTASTNASAELESARATPSKPEALPRDTRIHRVVYSLAQLAAPLPSLRPSTASSDVSHGNSTGAVLQVGAFQNEAGAHIASKEFDSRYGNVRGLTTSIQKVDLGTKGVWYRVRLEPFADSAVATTACAELKLQGTDCIVMAAPNVNANTALMPHHEARDIFAQRR
jgi:cell division protein FtsN